MSALTRLAGRSLSLGLRLTRFWCRCIQDLWGSGRRWKWSARGFLGRPRTSVRTVMGWASEQSWSTVRERLSAQVAASPKGQPCRWENFSQLPWETLPWRFPLFDLCLVHGCFLSLGVGPSVVALSVSTADSAPKPPAPSSTRTNEAAHAQHTLCIEHPRTLHARIHTPFW